MSRPVYTSLSDGRRIAGQLTDDGKQVSVWYPNAGAIGFYNIERFADGKLTAKTLRGAIEREDYSWSEIADRQHLCPSSPGYAEPHISTDGVTCDECGASVTNGTTAPVSQELPEDRVAAYLDALPNPGSDYLDEYGHGPGHRGLRTSDVRDVLAELAAARRAASEAEANIAELRRQRDYARKGREAFRILAAARLSVIDSLSEQLAEHVDPAPQGDPIETEND